MTTHDYFLIQPMTELGMHRTLILCTNNLTKYFGRKMHLYSVQKVSFFFCQIINGILPLHLIMKLPLFNQIPSLIFANRRTGCQIALKFKTAHDFAEKPEDIFSQLSLCQKNLKKWWPTMKTSVAEPKLFIFWSGSTFVSYSAPAPAPAPSLYCHLKLYLYLLPII